MKTIPFTSKILTFIFAAVFLISCDKDETPAEATEPTIDLKAEAISFAVNPSSQFAGTATITGSITNIGDDFQSDQNQQSILLYERILGLPAPGTQVAKLDFNSLAAGETLEVSFTRAWNASSPAEGEFPPEYYLLISYDADLFNDGNPHNDDSNSENNELIESGMAINNLFE